MTSTHRKIPIALKVYGLGIAAMLAVGWAHAAIITFDPDSPGINDGDNISSAFTGVTFSSTGGGDGSVYASALGMAPTGSLVFAWNNSGFLDEHWGRSDAPAFEALFSGFLAHSVSIDYLSDLGVVTLEAFDVANNSLGAILGPADSDPQTLTFSTGGPDLIQRVRITVGHVGGADFGLLDNLVVHSNIPESGHTGALAALSLVVFAGWRRLSRRA